MCHPARHQNHPARRHTLSLSCESLSFCELAASGYYGNIFLKESHVSMPRKWKPPDDEYLKHLTEKDAVGLGINHSLTGDQYKFHVRKGENEEGDTELLSELFWDSTLEFRELNYPNYTRNCKGCKTKLVLH